MNDPIARFREAFERASRTEPFDATRAALATASAAGRPSVRYVLVKEAGPEGFVFFTNYESRKARELGETGYAALAFHWYSTGEQVRVEGPVARASAERSDAYFATCPRASNLSAMASPQSQVVAGRAALEARVEELTARWQGRDLVRPDRWGGYRLVPDSFEFWQGRGDRLHDRLRYVRDGAGGAWRIERLAP